MREMIPADNARDRPPFVVEADEVSGMVMFIADGHPTWISPAEARRIVEALLQAAGSVDRAVRGRTGADPPPTACPTPTEPADDRLNMDDV